MRESFWSTAANNSIALILEYMDSDKNLVSAVSVKLHDCDTYQRDSEAPE